MVLSREAFWWLVGRYHWSVVVDTFNHHEILSIEPEC